MEIPGYTYDPQTRRYYKNPCPSSSFQNVATPNQSDQNQMKQLEIESKIDSTVRTIIGLEIGTRRRSKDWFKFSAYDSLLATRFTTDLFKFKRNIFLKSMRTPRGNRLLEPYCNQLVAFPSKDLLFGSWVNETGDCIFQIDARDLLKQTPIAHDLMSKNLINLHIDSVVEQLHPITIIDGTPIMDQVFPDGPTALFSIVRMVHSFPETSNLHVYHLNDLAEEPIPVNNILQTNNLTLELGSLYFCCDTYLNNSLVLGGENKCSMFTMTSENLAINIAEVCQFKTAGRGITQSIKFSRDGQFFFAGNNKGEIHLINVIGNNCSMVFRPNCSSIVDIQTLDENQIIVSGFDDYLAKLDVRFFKEAAKEPFVLRFKDHLNASQRIKFSIDNTFNTLTSCGQDNSIRIWSMNTGELMRIVNFKSEVINRIQSRQFSNHYLLDESYNQVISEGEETLTVQSTNQIIDNDQQLISSPNIRYYFDENGRNREQYHVVSSSDWRCLNKEKRPLIFGSVSDSVDLFY